MSRRIPRSWPLGCFSRVHPPGNRSVQRTRGLLFRKRMSSIGMGERGHGFLVQMIYHSPLCNRSRFTL